MGEKPGSSRLDGAVNWLYRYRRTAALTVYASIAVFSYAFAYFIRYEFTFPADAVSFFSRSVIPLVILRLAVNMGFRLSTPRWRFAGTSDVLRLTSATMIGTAAFYLVTNGLRWFGPVPRSVILIEFFLTICFTAGVWITYRT